MGAAVQEEDIGEGDDPQRCLDIYLCSVHSNPPLRNFGLSSVLIPILDAKLDACLGYSSLVHSVFVPRNVNLFITDLL